MHIGSKELGDERMEQTIGQLESDLAEAERQIAGHKARISNLKISENKRASAVYHLAIWEKRAEEMRKKLLF